MKTVKTFAGLKKGQKFVVVGNCNGHNYPLNTDLYLNRDGESDRAMTDCAEGRSCNSLEAKDICLIATSQTLAEIRGEIKSIEDNILDERGRIAQMEARIDLCEKLGFEEYNEDILKIYESLKVIKSKASDAEKAKVISQIIKGEDGI